MLHFLVDVDYFLTFLDEMSTFLADMLLFSSILGVKHRFFLVFGLFLLEIAAITGHRP